MANKILIALVLAMLVVLPLSHYAAYKHGRTTMNTEAVKRQGGLSFVLNGKVATLKPEIIRNLGTCGNCHTERV